MKIISPITAVFPKRWVQVLGLERTVWEGASFQNCPPKNTHTP